jgi:hypothetical protein
MIIEAKSRVRVYTDAAFKPFHYDQVLDQMKEYRSAVTSELVRIQALQMHDISQALPDELVNHRPHNESNGMYNVLYLGLYSPSFHLTYSVEAMLQKFKQWLAPTTYTSRYEDARSLRTPSTTQWIFDDPAYQRWLSVQDNSSLLWIHGKLYISFDWECGNSLRTC